MHVSYQHNNYCLSCLYMGSCQKDVGFYMNMQNMSIFKRIWIFMFIPNVQIEKTLIPLPSWYVEMDIPTQHWQIPWMNFILCTLGFVFLCHAWFYAKLCYIAFHVTHVFQKEHLIYFACFISIGQIWTQTPFFWERK
jgi:hypothetical protein